MRNVGSNDQNVVEPPGNPVDRVIETSDLEVGLHRNISHVLLHRVVVAHGLEVGLRRADGVETKDLVSQVLEARISLDILSGEEQDDNLRDTVAVLVLVQVVKRSAQVVFCQSWQADRRVANVNGQRTDASNDELLLEMLDKLILGVLRDTIRSQQFPHHLGWRAPQELAPSEIPFPEARLHLASTAAVLDLGIFQLRGRDLQHQRIKQDPGAHGLITELSATKNNKAKEDKAHKM